MPLTKSHPMAHSGRKGLPGRRKKPSEKHGIDGRFVAYYCEQCEDSGTMMCSHCQGSGIGSTGPVDSSTCQHCYPFKGSGSVPCDGEAHEYE